MDTGRWSDGLLEQTRRMIADPYSYAIPGGKLHMKNYDGRGGTIDLSTPGSSPLMIEEKEEKAMLAFASIDDLIAAGWAVD